MLLFCSKLAMNWHRKEETATTKTNPVQAGGKAGLDKQNQS
jgi:hypothetical protein